MVGWHVASASSSVILRHALRLMCGMCRVWSRHLVRVWVVLLLLRWMHAHRWSVALLHVQLLPCHASWVRHRPCLPSSSSTRRHCTMHMRHTAACHHMLRRHRLVRRHMWRCLGLAGLCWSHAARSIALICTSRRYTPSRRRRPSPRSNRRHRPPAMGATCRRLRARPGCSSASGITVGRRTLRRPPRTYCCTLLSCSRLMRITSALPSFPVIHPKLHTHVHTQYVLTSKGK